MCLKIKLYKNPIIKANTGLLENTRTQNGDNNLIFMITYYNIKFILVLYFIKKILLT